MEYVWYVFFTLLGLIIASFFNVCADRLPHGGSLISPPSHCDTCGRRLALLDLIPVFSYLFVRGHCRYCGATIPRRVLWVEIFTGAMFAFLFWKYGLTIDFAITAFYGCIFIVLFIIDLEHKLILNIITYPMIFVALLISTLYPAIINTSPYVPMSMLEGFIRSLIGGTCGFVLFLVIALFARGGMGWGDVKMAGMLGLATGFPLVFVAIMLAILTGGIVALFLLVFKIKKRKEGIPFGTFLAIGTMAALLYGKEILDWYLNLIH
jgi:leader peptidase (prepilin peptidase)/N-methyltransferase